MIMQNLSVENLQKRQSFHCLITIVDSKMRDRLTEFLNDSGIPIYYQMHGVGTVSSDFLNIFGLGDPHKNITICFVARERTKLLLAEMNQALLLHKKGTGIALGIPVSGMQGWLYKLLGCTTDTEEFAPKDSRKEGKKMSETTTHAMILVTIHQGYSDDVMYTARAAGATGGTILKGLKCSPSEVGGHFGIPIQEEQEVIAIVVPKDKKTDIMSAISKDHGIATPAHGIIVSLPVDAIMGL